MSQEEEKSTDPWNVTLSLLRLQKRVSSKNDSSHLSPPNKAKLSMSYAWHISRGGEGRASEKTNGSSASSTLGSAAVETPLTPPSVRNVSPSVCANVVQFRALMQEYRSLDDSVTTRLNRTLANSREAGYTSSPSLLSKHVGSSSSPDLGKSTYATAPEQACLAFWHELVNVWIGREEVMQYCLKVEESDRLRQKNGQGRLGNEEWLLNNDVERKEREYGLAPVASLKSKAKFDAFDSRGSRSEDRTEALRRQLKNELAVEAIIRKRSLDVFKSRCRFFVPSFEASERGEQEQAMWEGRETRAGQEARI